MMELRQVEQGALFYKFSLDAHVPEDHLRRSIDRFVDLGDLRCQLAPFYSELGRPSIDPELMIRMQNSLSLSHRYHSAICLEFDAAHRLILRICCMVAAFLGCKANPDLSNLASWYVRFA